MSKKKMKQRATEEYPTFNFYFNKVKEHCDKISKIEDKIIYLEYVKKEKALKDDGFAELYMGLPFEDKADKEIKYLKKKLKLQNPYMADSYHKIIWLQNKQDFAFLFHRLIERNFIKLDKEKYIMLCNHFKWTDGDMEPEQLKQAINNIKNRPETHKLSDDIKKLTIVEDDY